MIGEAANPASDGAGAPAILSDPLPGNQGEAALLGDLITVLIAYEDGGALAGRMIAEMRIAVRPRRDVRHIRRHDWRRRVSRVDGAGRSCCFPLRREKGATGVGSCLARWLLASAKLSVMTVQKRSCRDVENGREKVWV